MLSTSLEFRSRIAQNSKTLFKATLTLADGTVRDIIGDDVMMGSATFSEAVSSDGSFDIGAAIMGQLSITLNNYDSRFDEYDFTNSIIEPYVGVEMGDGTVEWLAKGRYGVDQPESYGSTIKLTALDNMRLLERPYSDAPIAYPATLGAIVRDICDHCGLMLDNADFANSDYVVGERPDDTSVTCLDVVGYAAQASGNFARIKADGRLTLDWYNTSVFEGEDWLDGQHFDDATPYASGDTADGGGFDDYSSGDSYDGGAFGAHVFANVYAYSSATIVTDDVVVTGVRVTAQDEVDEDGTNDQDGETALSGTEGYVLTIEGNPLIQFGHAREVANRVAPRVVGMRFRPFDVSAIGDPAIEAGDPIILTDRHQNQYTSYITSLTYKVGAYEALSCGAETPGRNSATSFSNATKAIVQARNAIKREKSARERAVAQLSRELAQSSGLYETEETQPDGSTIYYMHDKPTLRESRIIWKLTANAFGISNDGGETYPYSLDVSGNAILNRIYAVGLDADFITTGSLVVRNDDDRVVFSADVDTGQVTIEGECVRIGSLGLPAVIDGIEARYGICTSVASSRSKRVTCENFRMRPGALLTVKFTYENTVSDPVLIVNNGDPKSIYINNAPITEPYYWNAQDVITFAYSGNYWYVVDAGALSKIKATSDAITLSVSQTYATKSELELGLGSISLSASNAKLGSSASIVLSANGRTQTVPVDLTGVRNAFKNDSSAITISAGIVTFNSNTFVVNSTNFSVTNTGVITARAGTIGGFTIGSRSLYSQKTSLESTVYGTYLGYDGLSVGDGDLNMILAQGYLRGGSSANTQGYLSFRESLGTTTGRGSVLAGKAGLVLLTNGNFGIGSYASFAAGFSYTAGQSGTIRYVSSIQAGSNGTITYQTKTCTFTKGIMTTVL